ncbi:MAG: flagella basal body P-ring formation protein FlgA [Sulfurimonas sp.]|jgi:flagella basal body P-ring formation protein FlgA|uniref:flagellar basal body P-ring formation chaperone FlgA n=1 Tax=Sulfurimonas sp. TaxID=2022749 RepID=UPI0039E2E82A
MLVKIFLIFLFSFKAFAITLNSTYYIDSRNIKLQDILPSASYDVTLFKIEQKRYTKRVKSKEVLKLLKEHGFKNILASSSYILFTKNSPIDTSKIKSSIATLYKEKYPDIKINSIFIMPRGYIKSLPKQFEIIMQKRSYLSRSGTLSIKTLDKKKLFFNYTIDAKIYIYVSKKSIKRNERISALNSTKKSIQFDKFRAIPINVHQLNVTQSKRNLKVDSIITSRDIETLNLVKRGAHVTVNFKDNSINISFSAKALQNGKLNDIITIEKRNKKRLKVRVIGKNRVEVK